MEIIEPDQESRAVPLVFLAYRVDLLLRADPEFFRSQHDRGAVGIVSADIYAVVPSRLLETHPDIRLHLLQQMAEMQRAVGVGQRAGYQYSAGNLSGHEVCGFGKKGALL